MIILQLFYIFCNKNLYFIIMDENNIFNLIKLKKFKKLKKIINDTNINLNIFDENNNYLIHYILLYNQIDILKIMLNKDIRLDIIDIDGKTILNIPIKFNYFESLKLLLNYNYNQIGISIIDIKDKLGLTPLHYCVILDNFKSLKLLIKFKADPLIRNNDGNNVIHLCLQYERNEMIDFLKDIVNLNFMSINNETLLQYSLTYKNYKIFNLLLDKNININNQDKDGVAVIHQIIISNNSIINKLVNNKKCDINLQDFYGNNALMYAISYNLINQINILLTDLNLNFNLINLFGNTAFHLLLKNFNNFNFNENENENEKKNIINNFIINTDLNIQDNDGNTCLFYLIELKLLEKFKDLLEDKLLNIFIKNNKNITIYNLISKDINCIEIIINSFYNYLQKNKNKLILDWEIECSQDKLNIVSCKNKIKNIIINENRSIPFIYDYNLIIDHGIFVKTCYYTGASIDILFGILFLYNTFKNKNLNLIIDYPLTSNPELEEYFESLGINYNYKLDFCNFEINWSYQKIIYPTYFDFEFEKKIKISDYIIIPLGIETNIGSHANILFYDIKKNIIERFDPNGSNNQFNYNSKLLDELLELKFNKFNKNIKFIKPNEYLPVIGFQILENINTNIAKRIGDPNGFCGVWCIWWIYYKMKYNNIDSSILANELIKNIKYQNINLKKMIRNFSKNITDLRDMFLEKYDSDINNFINGNYNDNILNKLEINIFNYIK